MYGRTPFGLSHRDFERRDPYLPWNSFDGPSFCLKSPSSTPEDHEPGASRNRKCMRYKMKGKWQEDPNFFQNFFRLKASAYTNADAVRNAWYNEAKRRWKRVPVTPKKASSLISPLRNLLNSALEISNIPSNRRVFLKPNPTTMRASRSPLPPPDLLLAGVGPAITDKASARPEAEYSYGLVPVQVILESEFRSATRHLSAAHANEIFMEQDNRRFVFALILTEIYLRIYMFDPAGAVVVPRLDYHARPRDFCAIIEGIASLDEVRAGFDTSISSDEYSTKRIRTLESIGGGPLRSVSYIVKSRLFRASRFIGRATCCWLAETDEEPRKLCVIKDAWIATSEDRPVLEGSLIRHANQRGVVRGIVRILHEAHVQVPGFSGDTTIKNRKTRKDAVTDGFDFVEDRIHTRIVMDTHGKPLEKFSSRHELVSAFHDAVQAHRELLLVAGILHRDVSAGNILINPGGGQGDRGILIDLDFAAHVKDLEPGCRMGTFKYMSLDLLKKRHIKHSHLHDLESFYYVLCWIVCVYKGPGCMENSRVARTPEALRDWNSNSPSTAAAAKQKHIEEDFELPVNSWFGETIFALAKRLHGFFQRRGTSSFPLVDTPSNPAEDYAEFLGHTQWAIDNLQSEGDIVPLDCPSPEALIMCAEPSPSKPGKRKALVSTAVSAAEHKEKRFDNKAGPQASSIATGRPRRSKANYKHDP